MGLKAAWDGLRGKTTASDSFLAPKREQFVRGIDLYDFEALSKDQNPMDSATVQSCLRYLSNATLEAEMAVRRLDSDAVIEDHPLVELLMRPAEGVTHTLFIKQLIRSFFGTGNAVYLINITAGNPTGLQFYPWSRVQMQDGMYHLRNKDITIAPELVVPPEQVLHLRYALDDDGKGIGPFAGQALKELLLDAEVLSFLTTWMHNKGEPGWIIGPPDDTSTFTTDQEFDNIKRFVDAYNRGNRGKAMAVNGRFRIEQIEPSLQRLSADELRQSPRAAICGILGVPTRLALVNAGGPTVIWGDTLTEERIEAYTHTVIPNLINIAEQIDLQLNVRFYDPTMSTYFGFIPPDLSLEGDTQDLDEPADADTPTTNDGPEGNDE